ncbi:hypothetical protein SmJEL517_g04849 [Synchytrium microbalum]|uniref:Decapping nuclease n=1 Tax=Synchytrium microbalum TaxID=1806994 RepID=A0A507BYK0_9FUNG|nr:uncharacterized protein SmJEL517_g04849 [Synchytrium microbalum]TPX31939.1 hypothetical protein SmJEL517_g04849 [Synchytrium microbalum]
MKRAASPMLASSEPSSKRRTVLTELPAPGATNAIATLPTNKFQYQRQVVYQQPTEVACFTYDGERQVHVNSSEGLKPFIPLDLKQKTYDLSIGFPDGLVQQAVVAEHLDAFVQTCNPSKLPNPPAICTWRGIMTKLCATPYSTDKYTFVATRWKGTVYISELITASSKGGNTDRDKRFMYFGYKFEQYATSTDWNSIINTNEQYCSIFKTKLGETSLLLGGEVDCMMSPEKPTQSPQTVYAELKTSRIITDFRGKTSFHRHKLMKIWLQSFLAGVPVVLCAFRDDNGLVKSVETYETKNIPRMARSVLQAESWDANVCLAFGDAILNLLKKSITKEGEVFGVGYDGGKEVKIWPLSVEYQFLPESFLQKE